MSVVDLGCQHFCQTITTWLRALKTGSAGERGLLVLGKSILWNGKSAFYQIESDGKGVTLRPSHLTGTNGCTRLPVEASTLPSKSPSQIDSASSATENTSDLPTLNLTSDGLPPLLEMPFSHRWDLNWVWTCLIFQCFDTYGPHAGARHYSSFKYRILDCFTDSNFTMPHSKAAGDKSRDRPQVIYHFSKTKQDWDDFKFSSKWERRRQHLKVGCFISKGIRASARLPQDILRLECFDAF